MVQNSPPTCGRGQRPAAHSLPPLPFARAPLQAAPPWPTPTASSSASSRSIRSEEHTSELQSLMRISYAVFCLKKKKKTKQLRKHQHTQTENTHRSKCNTNI